GTELMPQAAGEAKVESKTGRLEIDAKLNGMEPANKFGLEYLTYVLWAITPEGRANNLAEVVLDNGKSEMHATTDLQAFGLIITDGNRAGHLLARWRERQFKLRKKPG